LTHRLTQDEIDALLQRLQDLSEERDVNLTADERKAIREIIKAWRIWQSFGTVGRMFAWTLMGIAALALAWGQIRAEAAKWFNL
jgi:hypothetical protein